MKTNERQAALTALMAVFKQHTPLMHLTPQLTPFTKQLCFGVCRHYLRLEVLAYCFIKKKPQATDIWLTLLLGLYQLHYLKLPDYAVVKESVDLLRSPKNQWAKGLINAVLRNYCRKIPTLISTLEQNPLYQFGQPTWLLEQLQHAWPADWQAIAQANDTHAPMSLRVNPLYTDCDRYQFALQHAGLQAIKHRHAPYGLNLVTPCDVNQLPDFAQGACAVQDQAAQLAAPLLNLSPGLRVLDACCAPGGKLCDLLASEPQLSVCIGLDVDPTRLQRVRDNLTRLNGQATLIAADATHPETWWDGTYFDRILLDAPCSATGIIRRHPDIKWLRTPAEITSAAITQAQLLQALWPLLASGGRLVYATCSILPVENEMQISQFLLNHPDARTVQPHAANWGRWTGHGQQILPGEDDMDGFFYAILEKK